MNKRSKAFISFILLAVVYLSASLIVTPPHATLSHYNISASTLRLLDSTVILPVVAIWFIGLYGYQKLRIYANHVQHGSEGKPISQITDGVAILAFWLPISATSSTTLNLLTHNHPDLLPIVTILNNYISLLFPLIAFIFISRGARRLSEVGTKRPAQSNTHLLAITLICMAVFYAYLVTKAHATLFTIYHMPLELVLLTIAVPYVFTWYLGLTSVSDLQTYGQSVRGLIYRKGWGRLSFGIIWLVIMFIIFQFVTTVSARLNDLSLGLLLLIMYGLLIILAVGYVLIALGAKQLTKIEEL